MMHRLRIPLPQEHQWARTRRLTGVLFAAWLTTTFCVIFFARELSQFTLFGWPCSYYMAAQGATLIYLAIVGLYAWGMARPHRQRRDVGAGDK